jgi:hypothetical protein
MSDFETWWQQEGQEFLFALNTTTDDDIKLVAEVAWKNGAYCAEQAEHEHDGHWSDCSVHNEPAYPNGPCDCGGYPPKPWRCACGANLYIDSNGAPASKAEQALQKLSDFHQSIEQWPTIADLDSDVGEKPTKEELADVLVPWYEREDSTNVLAEQAEQEPVALSKTERDAKRYAYMMHPDFFEVCDVDSRVYRYKVGLQSSVEKGFPKPINQCIEGYGETLEAAIDMAIAAQQPVSEPVARVIVRPFNPMDASCPTTEVKWLKEPVPGFLYAAPVRTKDLTEQEKANIIYAADHRNPMAMLDEALLLLKEKNTPQVCTHGCDDNACPECYLEHQEPIAKVCHDLAGHIGWNPDLDELPEEGTLLYTTPPSVEAAIERERLMGYASGQMAVEAMRIETLEKAAKVCDRFISGDGLAEPFISDIAAAIRSMK